MPPEWPQNSMIREYKLGIHFIEVKFRLVVYVHGSCMCSISVRKHHRYILDIITSEQEASCHLFYMRNNKFHKLTIKGVHANAL